MNEFVINPNDKFFPDANEWMWDYCTFLGKFTDSKGDNYDLGIFLDNGDKVIIGDWSSAIVYGNIPGNYISGGNYELVRKEEREFMIEMLRRARILNLIK